MTAAAPSAGERHRAALGIELQTAARALLAMSGGRNLDAALAEATRTAGTRLPVASRPAVRNFAYQAARRLGTVRALLAMLASRPPAPEVGALLQVALAQMLDSRRHDAVVVDQAVTALRRDPATAAAAGFANAVLRRFGRERVALLEAAMRDPVARHEHPAWWIDAVRRDHPADWERILEVARRPPPMTLRANRRRTDRDALRARFRDAGIESSPVGDDGLLLAEPRDVDALPGFREGLVSVQDWGAQPAAPLLDARDGERVLDACAAPGGKTAHILERADCELLALDVDPARLERVRDNLRRLGLEGPSMTLRAADARDPASWWDGRPFDRILVDAPCSASGIVRRHPDVRWLRQPGDPAALARTQQALLAALWPLLAPGGTLLYVTCSLFRAENDAVVDAFLSGHPDARPLPLDGLPAGLPLPADFDPASGRLRLLPSDGEAARHDGFFYARIQKQSSERS